MASKAPRLHLVSQFESRNVPLKAQEITLICRYTRKEIHIAQIIQEPFKVFPNKELQNVEKHLYATI